MSPIIGSLSGSFAYGRGKAAASFIVASGGSISEIDGYRIHKFTSGTDTFSISSAPPNATIEVLVVGGGGPGGNGLAGGGGGGAVIHNLNYSVTAGNYSVVVGDQSPSPPDRANITGSATGRGYDSTFANLTAQGGGQGGWWDGAVGRDGGCGGGGSGGTNSNNRASVAGGNAQTGTNVFANPGGRGIRYPANNDNAHQAGGGGGAGTPGRNWTEYQNVSGQGADAGTDGGGGYYSSIDGTARYWAGGGGGSCWQNSWAGRGGVGGGGGGNVANANNILGSGGGGALNSGGAGGTNGGDGGTNTGGGGGGSSGNTWLRGPGGRGGSGIVIVRYPYISTATGYAPGQNLGLTADTAAESAVAIKRAWSSAPDRGYWIKPSGQSSAYFVHCLMNIEGGGWELAWRNNSTEFGPFGSGAFLVGNWAGWAWSTKSQVDTIGQYDAWRDANAFAPTYYARDFTDVMFISNRKPEKRIGARFNSGFSSLLSVINNSTQYNANSLLFGDYNLCNTLSTRGDTNRGYGGGSFFAFKAGSDSNSPGDNTGLTGGAGGAGWTRFQVGVGRSNSNGGYFGGGFGAISTSGPTYHRFSGHFWGHGDGRNSSVWTGDRSSPFEGHACYVRKEAP